jgi:hypothetical protein
MGKAIGLAGALASLALSAGGAKADTTAIATWVSNTGVDNGVCSLAAPCRTFQYAHDHTSPGGEIDVKDAGRYGLLKITKAISVVAAGVQAGMTVPAGATGIEVNAGASDTVVIRGLTIDGHGVGANGIHSEQAAYLLVKDSVLQGMTNAGLFAEAVGNNLHIVSIDNVVAQNNFRGIFKRAGIATAQGQPFPEMQLSITSSKISHNQIGFTESVWGGHTTAIISSTIEFNSAHGIAQDTGGSTNFISSTMVGNGPDVFAGYYTGGNPLTFTMYGTSCDFDAPAAYTLNSIPQACPIQGH